MKSEATYSSPLLQPQPQSIKPSSSTSSGEIQKDAYLESGSCRICLESGAETGDELISPCMCKGTQKFVHRSCLDHWRSVKEGFAFSHCTTCKARFHFRVEDLEKENSWRRLKFRLFVGRDVFLVFLAVQTVIAVISGLAYALDKDGTFRNSFDDYLLSKHPIPFYYCIGVLGFFVLLGFLGLAIHCSMCCLGNNAEQQSAPPRVARPPRAASPPRAARCQDCVCVDCGGQDCACVDCGCQDCFPARNSSTETETEAKAWVWVVIVFVIIFAIFGIVYGIVSATLAIQRIWQRHYHILTKRELTQEYVVEDLRGCYTPPKLDPKHEERLKMLKLL